MKKYILLLVSVMASPFFTAQTTELFETETAGSASFTDNGQVFNITSQAQGPFDIQNAFPGTGWNGTAADNQYIDNSGTAAAGLPVGFTISSAGSVPFKLNSMYMFFSNGAGLNQSVPGSLTLTGKLGGVTQYTASAASGFVTSTAVNNGFTFINMATFGGSDNANTVIDQIVITTGGQYEYVALDAFRWTASSVATSNGIDQSPLARAGVNIYPNPNSGLLSMELTTASEVSIRNALGQVIFIRTMDAGIHELDIQDQAAGLYVVKIIHNNRQQVLKLIKQ